jgi:formyl-CoA transferase
MQGSSTDPQVVYGSVVDYYAASLLAGSVASALYARERNGVGSFVGVSLLRSALAMQSARLVWAEGEERQVYRDMRSGGITGLHPTREGSLYLSANTPHFWTSLCELIGLPALATDPRYDTVRKRAQHADELVPRIHAALSARTASEWERHFGERVPSSVVREVEDMFDDEQVRAESMIETFEHPSVGRYRGFKCAYKFETGDAIGESAGMLVADSDRAPSHSEQDRAPLGAPTFGQHSDAILARFGYSVDDIAALRRTGAVA